MRLGYYVYVVGTGQELLDNVYPVGHCVHVVAVAPVH